MNNLNTRKQGDIGVSAAILHFTKLGWAVSKPLADSQRYDLIVDDGTALYRVECKTSNYTRNDIYEVKLATSGGNQSWSGIVKKISAEESELVFICTSDYAYYVIPTTVLDGMSTVNLGRKYEEYKVNGSTP